MVVGLAGSPCAAVRLEEVGLSIEASDNSIEVSVQIDIESLDVAGKADTTALYTTRCSYNVSHPTSASHSLAATHNPTASGGVEQLAANATRGFFLNSTGSPSATRSLRVPSQVTLASLSRASYPTLASGSMLACVVAAGCLIFFVPL